MEKVGKFNKKCERNQGFSLIELIIAIAILVILTGLLAPQFMKYIEKSRKAVCDNNIDVILSEFQVEQAESGEGEEEVRLQAIVNKYQGKCPSGGTYLVKKISTNLKDDRYTVTCDFHRDKKDDSADQWVSQSDEIYKQMADFAGKDQKAIAKLIGVKDGNVRNDTLRDYLFAKNGNKWPVLDEQILEKYGITGGPYYIQPYMNKTTDLSNVKTDDVFIYANTTAQGNRNWASKLIYDPETQTWYMSPESKVECKFAGKDWNTVRAETIDNKENPWIPLK